MKLSEAILGVAECVKGIRHSVSTSAGTTTSLIDSRMDEPDDFFTGGTIFFITGNLAGKSAIISEFSRESQMFVFEQQTAAPGSGAEYAVLDRSYTREDIIGAINQALDSIGMLPRIYQDDGFVTVSNQEIYVLPDGISKIRKVFIATSAVEPYGWQENNGWYENNGSIIFDVNAPTTANMLIRLYFHAKSEKISHADDPNSVDIPDEIHPELLKWSAAFYAALARTGVAENSEPHTKELLSFCQGMMASAITRHPIKLWSKTARSSGW